MTASTDRPIHVAFASDDRGVEGLVVAAASVLAHSSRPVHLWVIEEGIDAANQARMRAVWERSPRLAGVHFSSQRRLPVRLPSWWARSRWPVSAASRFLLPMILPPEARRCIYLDIDILVGTDLGELFDLDLQGRPVAMNRNNLSAEHDRTYIASLGLVPDDYCNSGVLLMDLDAWRAEDAGMALIDLGRRMRPDLWFFDQDMLNTYFKGRCVFFDDRWNYRDANAHSSGRVLHFAGSTKPWHTRPGENDAIGFADWHRARTATGFVGVPSSAWSRWRKRLHARVAQVQRRLMVLTR